MDYAFGEQAYETMDELLKPYTDKDGKKTITYVQKATTKTELPKDVLYIMDGKEISEKEMKDLSPNMIQSINVLKGESAKALYGEKGKNGVIEIKTKK